MQQTGQRFIIQPENEQCHERDMNLHGTLLQSFLCPTVHDVVTDCIHKLVNVFCCEEEGEEQTMEEWVRIVELRELAETAPARVEDPEPSQPKFGGNSKRRGWWNRVSYTTKFGQASTTRRGPL